MALLEIKNLNWSYDQKMILKAMNLKLESGNFYAIVGPNGSGKTTLLKNILRHLEPTKDSVFIGRKDVMNYSHKELAKSLSSVPQNTQIAYDFSAYDVVMMGRNAHVGRFSAYSEKDASIVERAMSITDTWDLRNSSVLEISGGERQRIIIARAIAQQAQIMVLDEPISNLDINHQVQVLDTVKSLCSTLGLTVITVLHDLNIAGQYADEIIVLKNGEVLEQGKPEWVLREDLIKQVYGNNIHIINHPITKKPIVMPLSQL